MTLAEALSEHIALRIRRVDHFDRDLFREPAWDILIDLALARIVGTRVSVTDACVASGVPESTALRHLGILVSAELIRREDDPDDARRVFLHITDDGFARIEALFCPRTVVARLAA